MSYFAIAAFMQNNEPVGARVINTDTYVIKDLKNGDILHLIAKGYAFENVEENSGKLKWKQGSVDRYPQIFSTGEIKNKQHAVVIGEFSGDVRRFKICNYEGKQVVLTEDNLIKHGEKFGISNCKISHNTNGTYFIQSISGELPSLKAETTFKYRLDGTLVVNLPEDGSVTELQIPSMIHAVEITDLQFIDIVPRAMALHIKKLSLPHNIKHIMPSLFTRLPNIETLYIQNDRCLIYEYAFEGRTALKTVIMNGCNTMYKAAFKNCNNLQEIVSKNPIGTIGNQVFYGCSSLDIQKVFNLRPRNISGRDVLYKTKSSGEARIQEDTKVIDLYSLFGINGVNKIIIEGTDTDIAQMETISKYSGDIHLYIKERNVLVSRGRLSDGKVIDAKACKVYIHTIGLDEEDQQTQRVVTKGNMLMQGNEAFTTLKMEKLDDCKIVFKSSNQQEIKNYILRTCNQLMTRDNYCDITESLGAYRVIARLDYKTRYNVKYRTSDVAAFEDAIVYSGKRAAYVIPTNKSFILKHIEANAHPNAYFMLPVFEIKCHGKVIGVEHTDLGKDDELVIKFRNGAYERVSTRAKI